MKKQMVIGIILLFIITAVSPMVFGYKVNVSEIDQESNLLIGNRDNWYTTEVVSIGSSGVSNNPNLMISSDDTIHIAWSDEAVNYSGSGNDQDIFYKFKPKDGDWSNIDVVSTESNKTSFCPSLALDSEGIIHIVWYDYSDLSGGQDFHIKLFYKYKPNDGEWSETEVISFEADDDMWEDDIPLIMTDDYDTLHVIWLDDHWYPARGDIAYSYKIKNGNWSPKERATFDSTLFSFWVSAVVESDGTVHIAWNEELDAPMAMLHYKNRSIEGVWSEVEEMQPELARRKNCLAIDNDETIHIVYNEEGSIYYNYKHKGVSWGVRKYISYSKGKISKYPKIDVDNFGNIHVAWEAFYESHGNNAIYRYKRVNGEWSEYWEIVNSETGGKTWDIELKADNEGFIHFTWQDNSNYQGSGSDMDVLYRRRIFPESDPPNKPIITGPDGGKAGTMYTYTANTSDHNGDDISYFFDWGDGTNSGWTWFTPSGTPKSRSHIWLLNGTYTIKVKAKDVYGFESDWRELEVSMPREKAIHNTLIYRILDMFPLLNLLLQRVLY